MKQLLLCFTILLLVAGCQSGGQAGVSSTPGQGAVSLSIVPNPIVATRVSGTTYDFPFEVLLRETGGRPITVSRVSATVLGPGGIALAREAWDAEKIRSMGYGTSIPAGGELRYRFAPRRSVPDDRLFGGVTAELKVEAADDSGSPTSATTTVSVTR